MATVMGASQGTAPWIIVLAWTTVVAVMSVVPVVWSGDSKTVGRFIRQLAVFLPFGEPAARACTRGIPSGVLALSTIVMSATLMRIGDSAQGDGSRGILGRMGQWMFWVGVALLVVHGSVMLFNKPILLVPPRMRRDRGLVVPFLRRFARPTAARPPNK